MLVTQLIADAGRPDATELSRVVAVRFARALGDDTTGAGTEEFAPTGSITTTPATALELAPGDVAGLAAAGAAWARTQGDPDLALSTELVDVARDAAVAHVRLAERFIELQSEGAAIYAKAEELGVDGPTLGNRALLSALMASEPSAQDAATQLVARLVEVRLDWVSAAQAFIEDMHSARVAFDIADW